VQETQAQSSTYSKQMREIQHTSIKEEPYRNKFDPSAESDGSPGGKHYGEVSPSSWVPEEKPRKKKTRDPVPNTEHYV